MPVISCTDERRKSLELNSLGTEGNCCSDSRDHYCKDNRSEVKVFVFVGDVESVGLEGEHEPPENGYNMQNPQGGNGQVDVVEYNPCVEFNRNTHNNRSL